MKHLNEVEGTNRLTNRILNKTYKTNAGKNFQDYVKKKVSGGVSNAPSMDSLKAAQDAKRVASVSSQAKNSAFTAADAGGVGFSAADKAKFAKTGKDLDDIHNTFNKAPAAGAAAAGAGKAAAIGAGIAGAHIASTALVAKKNLEAPEKKIARYKDREGKIAAKTDKKIAKISSSTKKTDDQKQFLQSKAKSKLKRDTTKLKSKQKYYKHFVDEPKNEEIITLRNFIIENSDILSGNLDERISRGAKGATIGMAVGSAPGAFIGHAIGKAVEDPEDKKVRALHNFEKKAANVNYSKSIAGLKGKNTAKFDNKINKAGAKLKIQHAKYDFAQKKMDAKKALKQG